jgi:RNA polymerase sigma factor (sigma-70 family)
MDRAEFESHMLPRSIRTLYLEEVGGAAGETAGVAESAEDAAIWRIQVRSLRGLIASLPPRERELIVRRYFRGDTMVSIGHDFGISVARACEIHRRALDRLRKMTEEGNAVQAA